MLGVLDWGIGGLGFYARLKATRPDADVVYLSDAGATPYGRLRRDALADRVTRAVRFLSSLGADHIVVACNAASTVVPLVAGRVDAVVRGIIEPAVEMVVDSGIADLGIVGGVRTIRSGIYHRHLVRSGVRVRGRVAQPLSTMIEAGEWTGEAFTRELVRILDPLRECEGLLLACTHYPAALDRFRALLPSTMILDPVDRLLEHVLGSYEFKAQSGNDCFLTTGDPEAMRRAAAMAFGAEIDVVERVAL